MNSIPLSSRLDTETCDVTITPNEESELWEVKQSQVWNGTLRNTYLKQLETPTTTGSSIHIEQTNEGAELSINNTKLNLPFTSLLNDVIYNKEAIASAYNPITRETAVLRQLDVKLYELTYGDKRWNIEADSCMISSAIDSDPVIWTNNVIELGSSYVNTVKCYNLWEYAEEGNELKPVYDFELDETLKEIIDNMDPSDPKYRELLWQYDPRLEQEYYKQQYEEKTQQLEYYQKQLAKESDNTVLNDYKTVETNINSLKEQIKETEDLLYNYVVPEVDEEHYIDFKKYEDAYKLAESNYLNAYNAMTKAYAGYCSNTMTKDLVFTENWGRTDFHNDQTWQAENCVCWRFDWYIQGKDVVDMLGRDAINGIKEILSNKKQTPSRRYYFWGKTGRRNTTFKQVGGWNISGASVASGDESYYIGNPGPRSYPTVYGFGEATSAKTANFYTNRFIDYGWGSIQDNGTYINSLRIVGGSGYGDRFWANYGAFAKTGEMIEHYYAQRDLRVIYDEAYLEFTRYVQAELPDYWNAIQEIQRLKKQLLELRTKLASLDAELEILKVELDITLRRIQMYEDAIKELERQIRDIYELLQAAEAKVAAMKKTARTDSLGNVEMHSTLSELFTWISSDGYKLGTASSGTVINDHILIGFESIDAKARRILHYHNGAVKEVKWFGTVSPNGTITGEPIPLMNMKTIINGAGEYSINVDNTIDWNVPYTAGAGWQLIGGYTLHSDLEPIVIDSTLINEYIHTDMSQPLPTNEAGQQYTLWKSNVSDNRGIYWDYGLGWLKCYVRKINTNKKLVAAYIYTYGARDASNSLIRRENLFAGGKTKDYGFDTLEKRIYTVGGSNKADNSILGALPFNVEMYDELKMQVYGLLTLSYSYDKSLLSNGEDRTGHYIVQAYGNDVILFADDTTYVIKKTSNADYLKIAKVADYFFMTNILSHKNVLLEDRDGNVKLARAGIPYFEECVLNLDNVELTPPANAELASNDTYFWAAAYDPFYEGQNTSYMLAPITLAMYINPSELETYQEYAIDKRNSILKPLIMDVFNEGEPVQVFYTLASVTTTLYYKSTHTIDATSLTQDEIMYGRQSFDTTMIDTTYSVTDETQLFPIGIGSRFKGSNYISGTVLLSNNYSARMYMLSNKVIGGFLWNSRIYGANDGVEIFTIYGRNYYFDGQGIYFIGTMDDMSSNQFTCYALGLKFLAASGSEAYFYSSFDRSVYMFTGSNTLQRSFNLDNYDDIIDSVFSSTDQALYILAKCKDGRYELLMNSEKDRCAWPVDNGRLECTTKGIAVILDRSAKLYNPIKGDEMLPFKLKTVLIGTDNGLNKLKHFDYLLYKISDDVLHIKVTVQTRNGIETKEEQFDVNITPNLWKGQTYRLRISPSINVGNSFSTSIECPNEMAISYHGWEVEQTEATGATRSWQQ